MLSLYLHTPFCHAKCGYCSFTVVPGSDLDLAPLIDRYRATLHAEIARRSDKFRSPKIKTIYFGGGTPTRLGLDALTATIEQISQHRDLDDLAEITVELNPFPEDETLRTISTLQKKFPNIPRRRRSIGLQTFDSQILQDSSRASSFPALVDFLRELPQLKRETSVFNFDFIAFGRQSQRKNGEKFLRDHPRRDFFQDFVHSGFADGFSLYTLELFPGSTRHAQQIAKTSPEKSGLGLKKYGDDDEIHAEFQALKETFLDAGYQRYEISSFARASKQSIHNHAYRSQENYLGLGVSATSCVDPALFTADFRTQISANFPQIPPKNFSKNPETSDTNVWNSREIFEISSNSSQTFPANFPQNSSENFSPNFQNSDTNFWNSAQTFENSPETSPENFSKNAENPPTNFWNLAALRRTQTKNLQKYHKNFPQNSANSHEIPAQNSEISPQNSHKISPTNFWNPSELSDFPAETPTENSSETPSDFATTADREPLTASDRAIEKVILSLRTARGLENFKNFAEFFEPDRPTKLETRAGEWLCEISDERLRLTDAGLDRYNFLLTELLRAC